MQKWAQPRQSAPERAVRAKEPYHWQLKYGREIGKLPSDMRFIWHACEVCGKERWVAFHNERPAHTLCHKCACKIMGDRQHGSSHNCWKGGRRVSSDGYILINLIPDDFFYPMANNKNYVLEHRLVVAKALGRCLLPWEVVHHKGAKYPLGSVQNKQDNRYPENLELLGCGRKHNTRIEKVLKKQSKEIEDLQKRVTLLEVENVLLRTTQEVCHSERYALKS